MNANSDILFSILIPAYKSSYLGEAIQSCIDQKYEKWELIIVDDASPENLDKIVRKYNDKRIHYYRNAINFGAINVVDNWNKCLSYASGDYVICMGDDDRLLPCCLKEYVKLMQKYPDLGLYHAWTEIIDEKGNFINIQHPRPEYECALSLCWNRWKGRNIQFIGDFCFDANLLKNDGGFYKLPLAWASDDISAVRAARFTGVANTQVLCFQYRENHLTISNSGNSTIKVLAINEEKEWFETFIHSFSNSRLDCIELKYHTLLLNEFSKYFSNKIKSTVRQDLKRNGKNIFVWYRMKNIIGINRYKLFMYWLLSILKRLIN